MLLKADSFLVPTFLVYVKLSFKMEGDSIIQQQALGNRGL